MSAIQVYSETGDLDGVILHPPGPEVENMTPKNAERALYSDILNLSVARREYNQLECLLQELVPSSFRVMDLLKDILRSSEIREKIVKKACYNEGHPKLIDSLLDLNETQLAKQLVQGVPLERNTLSGFMSDEHFSLRPLHNFFFTRDASIALGDKVLISRMANRVRDREALIMQAIFDYHPRFRAQTVNPGEKTNQENVSIEGGDLLVAAKDITLVGLSSRTSSKGIDFLIRMIADRKEKHHILVQEMPSSPESFIHLDMTFTLLDRDSCMVYEPLILKSNKYQTIQIDVDKGRVVSIRNVENILKALSSLGMDLKPSFCGGQKDTMTQEREQWHSGANFFAIGPGKLIGYNRNVHTLENLNQAGYEIIKSRDVMDGKVDPGTINKYVITIDGAELSRGGGGVRCMTMPFRRKM